MLSKKADHSVLRLLQISQQHIESQLERVRHERELWKEVVPEKRSETLDPIRPAHRNPSDVAIFFLCETSKIASWK